MSSTPSWFALALVMFFAFDLVGIVLIVAAIRRKNRYRQRGFEVIVKEEEKER